MGPHQPQVPEWAVSPYQANFPQFSAGGGGINTFNVEGEQKKIIGSKEESEVSGFFAFSQYLFSYF